MSRVGPLLGLAGCALLAGSAYCYGSSDAELVVSSTPQEVSVFHFLRGGYYFLGYTPLKLTRNDLDGKTDVRLLLAKPGYQKALFDVSVGAAERSFRLNPAAEPYVVADASREASSLSCASGANERIRRLIKQGSKSQVDLQLPARWAQTDGGSRLVFLANLLNTDHISAVKRAARKDKDAAVAAVEALVKPLADDLLESFRDLRCLGSLLLIAVYRDKGMNVDFTPYRRYWSGTSQYTIGNTTYITTRIGSTVELQTDIAVTKTERSFLFQYKLH